MGIQRLVEFETTLVLLIVLAIAVVEVIVTIIISRELNKIPLTDYERQLFEWKYPIEHMEDVDHDNDEIDIKEVVQKPPAVYNRRRSDRNKI
jgi:hypothetical protein